MKFYRLIVYPLERDIERLAPRVAHYRLRFDAEVAQAKQESWGHATTLEEYEAPEPAA